MNDLRSRGPGMFGRLALGALTVTAISGVLLAPFYSAGEPLASVSRLQGGLPWGWYFRALHWASAQLLLLAGCAHGVEVIVRRQEGSPSAGTWWRSVLLLPLMIAALLSGFILTGDAAAQAALRVWHGLFHSVPVVGALLDTLVLGHHGLTPVLIHHVGTFTLILWLLTADHAGRWWCDRQAGVAAWLLCLATAAVVPLQVGGAQVSVHRIALGPWYMLGLQGMLQLHGTHHPLAVPPLLAGWLLPSVLLITYGALRSVAGRRRRWLAALLIIGAVVYGVCALLLLIRHGRGG